MVGRTGYFEPAVDRLPSASGRVTAALGRQLCARAATNALSLLHARGLRELLGAFRLLNIRLADIWYVVLAGVCLLAVAGVCLLFLRVLRKETVWRQFQVRAFIVFFFVVVLAVMLILVKEIAFLSYQFGVVPQAVTCSP